jgi:bifunctional non-homologous end joining protein LigD
MSTAVAPLSPRARTGAPVSMPVEWNKVKPSLDPQKFTMRSTPAILKKSAVWSEYCDSERSLIDASRKLGVRAGPMKFAA